MTVRDMSFLAFWFILLLSHAAECRVTSGVEERLAALEIQGHEQSQEIQLLNAELKFYIDQVNKYKKQNDDQATAIGELSAQLQDYKELAIENQKELSNYKTQLAKQETTIDELVTNIQDYEELANENQKELASYKTELGNQERRIKALEEEALIVDKHVNQHSESDVLGSPDSGIGLEEGQMKLTGNITHGTDELNDTTNTHKRIAMRNIESPVAFHATTDKVIVTHIGRNQNLALDLVLLNLGNGYHNQHGLFIAPVGGIYSFSASVMSATDTGHTFIEINIMKNGQALGRANAQGDGSRYDQGAITVVTQLVQGDEVWVAEHYPADSSYYGRRYTSFSGFLLY